MITPRTALLAGLGPITGAVTPAGTTALTGQGIYNNASLGTTATKVFAGPGNGKTYKLKITCVTAARNISWATCGHGGTSPANKADADGSADEGSLIMGGGGATEWITVFSNVDVYLVASGASTVVQVTCVESP